MVSSEGGGAEDLELDLELEPEEEGNGSKERKSGKSSPPQPSQPAQPTQPSQSSRQEPEERWEKNGTSKEETASARPTYLARSSTSSRSYTKEYYPDHPKSGTTSSYRGSESRPKYLKPKTGMYNGRNEQRTHPQKFRDTKWYSKGNAVNGGDPANESSKLFCFYAYCDTLVNHPSVTIRTNTQCSQVAMAGTLYSSILYFLYNTD